jgi:hypothetical protein
MRSSINMAVQATALIAATLMRFAQPGWLVIIFVMTIVGPLVVLGHVTLAMRALDRPRLPMSVAVPFTVAAACLLAANLVLADGGDGPEFPSPFESITGVSTDEFLGLGMWLLVAWGAALLWTAGAMARTEAEVQQPQGPGNVRSPA